MPLNILVVDNNPVILKVVSGYLEQRGYNSKTALDGIEALEILSSFTPDIMIVDLVMPGISGDKLCKVIRNNVKFDNTFLAILTATAAEGDIDYLSFGANTCIAKGPFDTTLKHIQAILDHVEHGGTQDFAKEILGRDEIYPRQITKELLEAQKHMKSVLNNLTEGVVEFDHKQRVYFINTSALVICGISEEKILGKNVIELFAEEDRKAVESLIAKALHVPQYTDENLLLCINGRIVNLSFLLIRSGETKSIILIIQDITAHQTAKEQLCKREEQYQTLLETVPHGIQENDLSGIITYSNAAHKNMLGYEEYDNLTGKPIWEMAVSEEDALYLQEYLAKLVKEQPTPTPHFSKNRTRDGRIIDVQVDWNYKRDAQGNLIGFIAIITDTTERQKVVTALRRSEERYRDLFENASDLIQMVNPQGKLLYVNRAWRKTFGYTDEEIDNLSIFDLIAKDCSTDCQNIFNTVLDTGRVPHIKTTFVTKDGKKLALEGSAICKKDEKGEPLATQCIFRDVTKQKELERQLLQAQKMQGIGTLAGGIAHDFNNLLSAIMGYTQLTMHSLPKGSEAHKNLQQVLNSSTRATELVKQILTFSRPSSDQKMGVLLQQLVKEALKFLCHSLPTTIKIKHHIDENCPPIFADATQLQQVVMNLCTNAYHAMRSTGGYMEVHVEKVEVSDEFCTLHPELSRKECVRLRVRDTGYGIAPEVQDRIFEPYFTTKEAGEGTGLGLAVVHGIVTSHHGVITISSEVDKGSTFTVYFPAMEQAALVENKLKKTTLPMLQANIMFIDDDADLAYLGKKSLEKTGCAVTAFTSSQKALQEFQADPAQFDLVITDQTMPELTGFELSKKLLALRSDLPIILCTGHSDIVDAEKAKRIGIKDFLMKPLNLHELAEIIQKIRKVNY